MPVSRKRKDRKHAAPVVLPVAVIRHRAAADPAGQWHYTIVRRAAAAAICARLAAHGAAVILPKRSLREAEHIARRTWAGTLEPDAELLAGVSQDGQWIRWCLPSDPPAVPRASDKPQERS
jgi:hypothetical protein